MQVYLVRNIETKGILGIFWGSKADVWDAVDELTDPVGYEAASLKAGALYTDGEEPIPIPFDDMDENSPENQGQSWVGFEASERFWSQLHGADRLVWKQMDGACEGVGLLRRACDAVESRKLRELEINNPLADNADYVDDFPEDAQGKEMAK